MSGSRKRHHSAKLEAKQVASNATVNDDNQSYHNDDTNEKQDKQHQIGNNQVKLSS